MPPSRTAAVLALVAAVSAAACGLVNQPETTRIRQPPDTGVKYVEDPPEAGVLAGGGTFRLTAVQVGNARCEVFPEQDPFLEFLENPLTAPTEESTDIDVPDDKRTELGGFLQGLEIRTATAGSAIVLPTGLDTSRSLPWPGAAKGGTNARVEVRSIIIAAGDREVSFRVELAAGEQDDPTRSPAVIRLSWDERPLSGTWLVQVTEGSADCNADATAVLERTGPAPAPPSGPPTGAATVLSVEGASGGDMQHALDLIGSSSWVEGEEEVIALQLANGQGIALGQELETGAAFVVQVSGTQPEAEFEFRGAKTADGSVRGTLLAGGALASVVLAG